jgi:UDP-N-acetylmuramate--L-alanine ligase/UDP-N-acetylenolpyruvoylglucosamine reductase
MTRWHFIGIGGAGMSALARALLDLGDDVSGSDAVETDATRDLRAHGARVEVGPHLAGNLGEPLPERVVVTAALQTDNPEWVEAQRLGLPVVKRADLLGQLMESKTGLAAAGTHGKTTTSAMLAWVLAKSGRDPSYMVGGTIRGLGAGGHWGAGRELVAEADEYDRSFLYLHPEVAIINNIETDHLEYYGSAEAIFAAFGEFAMNVKRGGLLLLGGDDPGAQTLGAELGRAEAPFRIQYFGLAPDASWRAGSITSNAQGGSDFAVLRDSKEIARVNLQLPGLHNVLNALGAFAALSEVGLDSAQAATLLGEFVGTGRRFELKGTSWGVTIIDDYAHHPTEIRATLAAARQRYPHRRIYVLFQPHTYTRTRDFWADFSLALSEADRVIVTEIYASRERDTLGVSGRQIVSGMTGSNVEFAATLEEAENLLLDDLQAGDVLITMGAGDVWKVGERVLKALAERATESEAIGLHIPVARDVQKQAHRSAWTFTPDIATQLREATGLDVVRDEPMSKHDSLRVGGPASMYVVADTEEQLVRVVLFARQRGVPYLVIGNGTNIMAGDYGVDGLVIHNKAHDISRQPEGEGDTSIWRVGSGVLFSRLSRMTCDAGWSGLEWSNSVPGSVGGGVVSNAGAHGKELKDDLISIKLLTGQGTVEEWPASALELGYRTSRFKAHGLRDMSPPEVILSADIRLYRDEEKGCASRLKEYLAERQARQPQGKSAGSTFKNPPGYSAGWLIEQVGMKGQQYGQAQFSPKHANFMMNLGGAAASDVLILMEQARSAVLAKFGIELEPEIELIGDTES